MTGQITVLIVDDHPLVRQGIRAYMETQPDLAVAGDASSGEQAVAMAGETVPDVVIMDLAMPGMDGVEAIRRIKRLSPRTQIVVLTSFHDDRYVFPAVRAGALSYLLKDAGPEELTAAVRRAVAGEAVIHPRVAARLIREVSGSHGEALNPFTELTEREMEVLRLIAAGLANHEIAERLVVSEKTVKGHVSNILSKLHLADRTQAAVLAWREGVVRGQG
jgi:two-component system, NarL family, response regulator LiaR